MSKFLNIQTNDFDSWFDSVNLNMEFWESPVYATRFGYEAGQQSRQAEIDELTRELEIMKGWAKIAQANGEDKLKYLNIISEALCALESTPYWDRSGNCEIAIDILKKTSE